MRRFGTIRTILKNMKNTREGVLLLVKLQVDLLKVTLLCGCFSHFLNCTNGTKSGKATYINKTTNKKTRLVLDLCFEQERNRSKDFK